MKELLKDPRTDPNDPRLRQIYSPRRNEIKKMKPFDEEILILIRSVSFL